jgi:hypothetical protein
MLAARLQLRSRCITCCSCSFSSKQAARRSTSERAENPQQHTDSAESQLQNSSSDHGHNSSLPTLEEQAEMNFEILAVMSKSNARFSTRQHIAADESEDEEEQNEKNHLAPQHRRFLSHPQIGAGMLSTCATST